MACAGCGTGVDGKPSGCKSNGGCSTGGCNRLNVFDWLSNIPLGDSLAPFDIIEVSFNNGSRKDFFRNVTKQLLDKGEMVTVEGVSGFDVGTVSLTGELVKLQMKKRRAEDTPEVKKVLRRSTNDDLQRMNDNKSREKEALIKSRALARNLGLEMKLAEVEIQADGRKATFFYTADDRVDFRELIKVYASEFRAKVEMRQIGARQEAGKVGGIGSCGRELCCSTWLSDFKSVNTTAARYQNLSINQAKLSGQCGRLKCCLNYELDTYLDALKDFPDDADNIETAGGVAHLQKRDIFKSLMWYSYEGSNKQYPLTISRAKEIRLLNKQGVKPEDLKPVEVVTAKPKEADLGYADVVGLISLKSLEKTAQKRKQKDKDKQKQQKVGEQKQAQGPGQPRTEQAPKPAQRPDNRQQQDRRPKQENRPPQQQRSQGGGQSKQGREQQPRSEQQPRPEQPPRQQGQRQQQGPRQQGPKQAGQQPDQPDQQPEQGGQQGSAPRHDRRPPRHKHRSGGNQNKNNNPEKDNK